MVDEKDHGERLARVETQVEQLREDHSKLAAKFSRLIWSMLTLAWSALLGLFVWLVKVLSSK